MTCPNCGADNPPTFHFCHHCGVEFVLRAAPPNPPPDTSFRRSRRRDSNLLFLGALGAGALVCACVCGLLLAWMYSTSDATSAQSAARPTPTRRATSAPIATQVKSTANTFNKWHVAQVEAAFKGALLEFANLRPLAETEYGTTPRVAQEAMRFYLPSLGEQKGGRIYSFANENDLKTVQQYYESGRSGAAVKPWILVRDNILIQFTGELPEVRYGQYTNTLNSMK